DWFDFTQIKETATLKDIYLDADKSLKRNKDNHSLSQYKPTIKETLSILDKQHPVETNIYTSIKEASFKGIADKPMLFTALSRVLVNYESEWYSEIDAEGKMPKWEELNSEMTEDAKNLLMYLKEADEAKCDVYVNTLAADEQKSVKRGLEELRKGIARFPADYIDSPTEKLSKGQLDVYFLLKQLEKQVTAWEKTKEKIKKMLWWDDVAKGLAKLNQQNDTPPENGEATNTTTTPTDTTPPATLSADGKAWFIHPVAMIILFYKKVNNKLKTSQAGLNFIYLAEARKNVSNKLHWPGTGSGITLGPGYDMKERSSENILNDLLDIGISSDIAQKVSNAAGLKKETEINSFITENKDVISLTEEQEKLLLKKIIPDYENRVDKTIKINLNQHEYDALVSFVYNIGSIKSDSNLAKYINEGKKKEAMDVLEQYNKSGGKVLDGLKKRREKEREIFEKGIYATKIY
ncbi:glycoside hydrolase family protein, partial [Gilliamella bombi]|uniref:glycoside hydrolase family protein n=1 Tax=Gilliamella bombi TaxID=1908521 RepID=UPI0014289B05